MSKDDRAKRAFYRKMAKRADAMSPSLVSGSGDYAKRELVEEVLPEGATLPPMSKSSSVFSPWSGVSSFSGGGGSSMFHTQRPYLPEFDSPDRQWYPKDRITANKYWRLFYKADPIFGTAVEMYSQMMTSDFDIILDDENDTSIKNQLMDMVQETYFLEKFQQLIKEFLVAGEAIPHCFFDEQKGTWSYIGFHNPDYIDIQDSPIIDMDPIISFIPDDCLRDMLTDNTPEALEIRQKLPPEFVSKVLAHQKIRLSPLNCSFIPRKLHPYDERGVSLASRLWRIWMVEDAVYNATISIFRRHACFIKGTKILTDLGIKNVEDIREGDTVISGEGKFKKVKAAWEDHAEEIVEIKSAGSELLECTTNHKFKLWVRPRKCACGCEVDLTNTSGGTPRSYLSGHYDFRRDPKTGRYTKDSNEWTVYSKEPNVTLLKDYDPIKILEAKDIKRGDYLLIPRKFEEIPMTVTEKDLGMARLLGYYVAEGCKRHLSSKKRKEANEYGVQLSFSLAEKDTWAKDIESIGDLLGVRVRTRVDYRENDTIREGVTRVNIDNVKDLWLASWCFENGGAYSKTKVLSEIVMKWPLSMKEQFIIGLFRGDGHSRKDEEAVHYATTSKSLAYQVRIILAQLGIYGSISISEKKQKNWNDCYQVISCGNGARKISKFVWGKDLVKKGSKSSYSWHWMDDDYIYVKVLSVKIRKDPQPVYNMTVEGDQSYIANGLATKNSPIKVLKLGDPNTGWIPSPETERKLLQMVTQAEMDASSWIVYNYGVNFETWGNTDRAVTLSREHDTIEKVKLLALGLSKGFMSGEVSFSSVKGGLQVFLRRLLSMRQFFESTWILPKFFDPIIQINDWVKSTPSEVNHRYRIKRTAQEKREQNLYISPKIKWKNKLDPNVDEEMLRACAQLRNLGFDVSLDTLGTSVSLDWEDELTKKVTEFKKGEEIKNKVLGPNLKQRYDQMNRPAQGKPPGGAGSGAAPPSSGMIKPTGKPPGGQPGEVHPPGSSDSNGPLDDSIDAPAGGEMSI